MAEKKQSYAEAMKKLEDIVSAVEKDELDIDRLSEKLKEAQKLVSFCKDKLYKTDQEIKRIMEEQSD